MKTSKKILIAILSIGISFVLSILVTLGVSIFISLPFWSMVGACMGLIFTVNYFLEYHRDTNIIRQELKKLNEKPFKEYTIESTCQSCGHKQNVVIDLNELEYKCDHCKRSNAIYVNFMTAAVTEPTSVNML
jgi:DNA-directed RNA polymerase subunit RPC12/RpoP